METRTESIGHSIRTGVVVVVITLLIWIAADQWVTAPEDFTITIQPVSATQDRYVAFAEPPFHRTVKISLSGRRSRIAAFRSKYESPEGQVIKIPIDDLREASTTSQNVNTHEDLLRRVPELRQSGVLLKTDPETFDVRIDRYEMIPEIPVRFDYGELRVRDKPETRKVTARMPGFIADDEQLRAKRFAVVNAVPIVSELKPGDPFEFRADVALEMPMDLPPDALQLTPESINVKGQVETRETTIHAGPVTIKWSVPFSVQRDYVIQSESTDFIGVYLDIRGPKDRVAQIDASDIRAFVEVYAADLASPGAGKTIVRDVVVLLPPQFSDCRIVESSELRQVRFRLEKRSAAAGPADSGAGIGD